MWYGIGALKMNAINAHTYSAHFQPDWDKNADAKNCSAFVDGTPTRLASWHAPKELLQLASQMGASFAAQLRLVAVLREPVSRHLSWYNHRLSTSNIKLVAKEKRKENEAFWNVVKDRCGTSFWKPREGMAPSHAMLAACDLHRWRVGGCGGGGNSSSAVDTACHLARAHVCRGQLRSRSHADDPAQQRETLCLQGGSRRVRDSPRNGATDRAVE